MQTTPNYNLKKIELTDSPPDITVLNTNWDKLDSALVNSTIINDTATGSKYKLGVENGLAFIEQVG